MKSKRPRSKKAKRRAPGPKADRLTIPGKWRDAVKVALKKRPPT